MCARRCSTGCSAQRPNQLDRRRDDVETSADQLLDIAATPGAVTEAGVRGNVSVAVRYLASWLAGNGAAAIDNLMEDAATAEISRSQIWQWIHNGTALDSGLPVTEAMVRDCSTRRWQRLGPEYAPARGLFERVALADDYIEFLTLPAYELID